MLKPKASEHRKKAPCVRPKDSAVACTQMRDYVKPFRRLFLKVSAGSMAGFQRIFIACSRAGGKAFVLPGQTVVTHGGISLDEVIVPFIEISRRKAAY